MTDIVGQIMSLMDEARSKNSEHSTHTTGQKKKAQIYDSFDRSGDPFQYRSTKT